MAAHEAGNPLPETSIFGGLPEKADLGQILLRQGVIRPEQLEECLRLQRDLASQSQTPPPRLGELLVQKGYATREAIVRALREQSKKILYCARCGILMNVDARPDAISYNCGRCQGPLEEPPVGLKDRCSDTQVIVNSRLPIPPEVLAARQDPARRFGKYVILEPLGRGGIAEVHRAWDTYLHQYVALKRIRTGASDGLDTRQSRIASLLNEAHNAIRLRHPNIVTVYDIGRVGNSFYISMEYLDGRTLYEEIRLCREAGRVSPYYEEPRKWLGVLFQAAHAVHYAHTRPVPIFHCDLKPGNIFVTREGRVCVLDFGLAHQVGEFRDEAGAIAGTPSYMAPEQVRGDPGAINARTDVYGLGTILYELLAGQPPFTGEMADVLGKVLDEPPAPPGRVAQRGRMSRVSPQLEEFCLRCLEKDPSRRPSSALEFAQNLERLAGLGLAAPVGYDQPSSQFAVVKEPLVEPPPPPPQPRSRGPWLAGVAFLGFLLAAGILWGLRGRGREIGPEARRLLAGFRPEKALELDPSLRTSGRAGDLGDLLRAVEVFKERLIRALNAYKPVVEILDVSGRPLRGVKIWKAGWENVLFEVDEVPDEVSWEVLGPRGVVVLAGACGLLEQPADRFGLAVYEEAAGAGEEARSRLESLRGTEYEIRARAVLGTLEGRK